MRNNSLQEKDGAAMIIAIVIGCVMMTLSVSMLLASSSLSAVVARQRTIDQCKELSVTMSQLLEKEITIKRFDSYEEQEKAYKAKQDPLWFYLRSYIWQPRGWSYLNEEVLFHGSSNLSGVYRYFQIDPESIGMADRITVRLSWETDEESYRKVINESSTNEERANAMSTAILDVQVTTEIGRQKSSITTQYSLTVDAAEYRDIKVQDDDGNKLILTDQYNSQNINKWEVWSWVKSERE